MMKSSYLSGIALAGVVALGVVVLSNLQREKKGFVLNQKVFEGFKGTKELKTRLQTLKSRNAAHLDSLFQYVKNDTRSEVLEKYEETRQQLLFKEQQLSDQYTEELWSHINKYVRAFGKEKHYDFIFGASGNGNLMYADESVDLTEEVIKYVNKKYDDK